MTTLTENPVMEEFVQACASADVGDGETWPAVVAGREVCLYRHEGVAYATEDRCSHGDAKLSDGNLLGHEIECPFHRGRFDIRTGQATLRPCRQPVAAFPVQERDGFIWIALAGPEASPG